MYREHRLKFDEHITKTASECMFKLNEIINNHSSLGDFLLSAGVSVAHAHSSHCHAVLPSWLAWSCLAAFLPFVHLIGFNLPDLSIPECWAPFALSFCVCLARCLHHSPCRHVVRKIASRARCRLCLHRVRLLPLRPRLQLLQHPL